MQTRKSSEPLPEAVRRKLDDLGDFPHKSNLVSWLERVFEDFTPEFVAIFGSVPRGQATPASDVDVVVVAGDFPEHPLRRLDVLNRYFIPNVDARPYTPAEFRAMVESWDLTVLEVLHDHWFLFDPTGFAGGIHETFLDLRRHDKLIRDESAWIVNI